MKKYLLNIAAKWLRSNGYRVEKTEHLFSFPLDRLNVIDDSDKTLSGIEYFKNIGVDPKRIEVCLLFELKKG